MRSVGIFLVAALLGSGIAASTAARSAPAEGAAAAPSPQVAPALQTGPPGSTAPDLVLVNGTVVTVDRAFSLAEAVAVTGDRITAVGPTARIRALAGPATTVIDLGGAHADSRTDGQPPPFRRRRPRRGSVTGPLARRRLCRGGRARAPDGRGRCGGVEQRLARSATAREAPAVARRPRQGGAEPSGGPRPRRPRVRGELGGAAPLADRREDAGAGRGTADALP